MLDELDVAIAYDHAGSNHSKALGRDELDTSAASKYERIVFLHRDARDTVVSGYHQATKRLTPPYTGSMSAFIRDPRHGIEKILLFNTMWLKVAQDRRRMLVVQYENLHSSPLSTVSKILAFLGKERSPAAIEAAVRNNAFAAMQAKERAGAFPDKYKDHFGANLSADPNGLKVRRGKVGGFVDELSLDDAKYCNELMARSVLF
ncbi:MAG: sulfotransferase domain-containing protein [Hyphomicrobiaceae bacterium]